MKKLLSLVFTFGKKAFHRHDFDMEFVEGSLNYRLVCKCGATAHDMNDALHKMGHF